MKYRAVASEITSTVNIPSCDAVHKSLGICSLPSFGGYEKDTPDDGYSADKEEWLGKDLTLLHEGRDGDQEFDEDKDQERPV